MALMLAEARLMEATLLGSNPAATSRDHRPVVTTHRRPRPCGAAAAGPAGRRRLRSDVGRAARATRPYTVTTNPGRQKDQSAPELAAAAVGGADQRRKTPGLSSGGRGLLLGLASLHAETKQFRILEMLIYKFSAR